MPTTSGAAPHLAAGLPAASPTVESPAPRSLRRGLLVLCAVSIAGTAVELAMLRHWGSAIQMVPWFALGALTLALAAVAKRPTPATLKWARAIAAAVALAAVFGMVEHLEANYHSGRRDPRYSSRWETMSTPSRWWAAASGGIRTNPVLAPAVLAEAAFCLALATAYHPAAGQSRRSHRTGTPAAHDAADLSSALIPVASPDRLPDEQVRTRASRTAIGSEREL